MVSHTATYSAGDWSSYIRINCITQFAIEVDFKAFYSHSDLLIIKFFIKLVLRKNLILIIKEIMIL